MQMWFYFGYKVTVLFEPWTTGNRSSYFLALVGIFMLGVLVVGSRVMRLALERWMRKHKWSHSRQCGARGFLALLCYGLDYMLMLTVMNFNAGVFISAVLGLATGTGWFGGKLNYTESSPKLHLLKSNDKNTTIIFDPLCCRDTC